MTLPDFDQLIRDKIEQSLRESPDDTLLGFLDVNEVVQKELLDAVRECIAQNGMELTLRKHPAVTGYVLAVAAPIGLREEDVGQGSFYRAWEAAIGFKPPPAERRRLGDQFQKAMDALGLPVGTIHSDHEPDWHGGCYLFQGGILPHFVGPLREVLGRTRRKMLVLPDPDDESECARVAEDWAATVHPAQQRLIKTLKSEVGRILVSRFVQWSLTGDDGFLPAHIRDLLPESAERLVTLHSPGLCFDPEQQGVLALKLPMQDARLCGGATCWRVGEGSGAMRFRADSERDPILLDELPQGADGKVVVRLEGLGGDQEDREFRIETGFPEARPIRVFDAEGGRERRWRAGCREVAFAPGRQYFVVLGEGVEPVGEDEVEAAGDLRFVRFHPTIQTPPLELMQGAAVWQVKVRVTAGLYLTRDERRAFEVTVSGTGARVRVDYGDRFGLGLCVPADKACGATIRLRTSMDPALDHVEEVESWQPAGANLALAQVDEVLVDWIANLQCGVHRIRIELAAGGQARAEEWTFFKGLNGITRYGDFRCPEVLANLHHAESSGFSFSGGVLVRDRTVGARAILAFDKLGKNGVERWDVPDNRIAIRLCEPEGGACEDRIEGDVVDVVPGDTRYLVLETRGLLPVVLRFNGQRPLRLDLERRATTRYIPALVADFGRTGVIDAELVTGLPGDLTWKVLEWRSPLTAQSCDCLPDSPNQPEAWVASGISLAGVGGLRVVVDDVASILAGAPSPLVTEIPIPAHVGEVFEQAPIPGLRFLLRRRTDISADLEIEFDRAVQSGKLLALAVECRLDDNSRWQPLLCREKFARLSEVRFLLEGWGEDGPGGVATGLFRDTGHGFVSATSTARWLTAWRYPSEVWKRCGGMLRDVLARLANEASKGNPAMRRAWWSEAIGDLDAHAGKRAALVSPLLVLGAGPVMTGTRIGEDGMLAVESGGPAARALAEAARFENLAVEGTLDYLRDACQTQRIDLDFLKHFAGFPHLLKSHPVPFGGFDFKGWIQWLRGKSRTWEPGMFRPEAPLLGPDHLMHCLSALWRRVGVLRDVFRNQESGVFIEMIAWLHRAGDNVDAQVLRLAGAELGAPAELLWRPFTDNDLLVDLDQPSTTAAQRQYTRPETITAVIHLACLLALLGQRARQGRISRSDYRNELRALTSNGGPDSALRCVERMNLVLGTAPELWAYYTLLFTMTLHD